MTKYEFDAIVEQIKSVIALSPATVEHVADQTAAPETTVAVIRWMLDNEIITEKNNVLRICTTDR
jgi:hypothetical protein